MKDRFSSTRISCLRILFGPTQGKELAEVPWHELARASRDPDHPLVRTWTEHDRARLFALMRLCEIFYPLQVIEPEHVNDVGDLVARFRDRTRALRIRTMWLVCIDQSGCVTDESLLQMGGEPCKVPAVRSFLRHAIVKDARAVYVVDFRPVTELLPYRGTVQALKDLTEVGKVAGIAVLDWVLLGPNGACSVRERVAEVRQGPIMKEADEAA